MVVGRRDGCRRDPAAGARAASRRLDQQPRADYLLGLRRPGSLRPGRWQPHRQPLRADSNPSASADTRTDPGADAGGHAHGHPHARPDTHAKTDSFTDATGDADPDADSPSDVDPNRCVNVNARAWRNDLVGAWLDLLSGRRPDRHTREPNQPAGSRNSDASRRSRSDVWFKFR
jgi:hypothetical protein